MLTQYDEHMEMMDDKMMDDVMVNMMDAWNGDDEWWYDGWWDGEDEWWDGDEKMIRWYNGASCPYEPVLNHQTTIIAIHVSRAYI